jgi:photosystem II stability/assembly factor-like uncharacterized protein
MDHVDNQRGMHIYAIAAQGSTIYLAGEQGLFMRSTDGGVKFTTIATPYKGTFFTMALLPTNELILAGMRGNAFRSADQGKSFTKVDLPIPVSLSASVVMPDGPVIFSNQAGMILASNDRGKSIHPILTSGLPPIAGLADAGNGMLMTVGYGGAIPISLNAQNSTTKNGGAK